MVRGCAPALNQGKEGTFFDRCELSDRVGVGDFIMINLETLTPLLKMHL